MMPHPAMSVLHFVLSLILVPLVGAYCLRKAITVVVKIPCGYGAALKIFVVAFYLTITLSFLLGLFTHPLQPAPSTVLPMAILGFLIQSWIFSRMIRDADGVRLRFGRACLVNLAQIGFFLVFLLALALVAGLVALVLPIIIRLGTA